MDKQPLVPVKPVGVDLVFTYHCPHCSKPVPILATAQPAMARCDSCHRQFPVVPVDEKTILFVKTILGGGPAAVDPEYV